MNGVAHKRGRQSGAVAEYDRQRKKGLCPYKLTPCARARRCTLEREAACVTLISGVFHSCSYCRRKRGVCELRCFLGESG
jgi:hypothetical protein